MRASVMQSGCLGAAVAAARCEVMLRVCRWEKPSTATSTDDSPQPRPSSDGMLIQDFPYMTKTRRCADRCSLWICRLTRALPRRKHSALSIARRVLDVSCLSWPIAGTHPLARQQIEGSKSTCPMDAIKATDWPRSECFDRSPRGPIRCGRSFCLLFDSTAY